MILFNSNVEILLSTKNQWTENDNKRKCVFVESLTEYMYTIYAVQFNVKTSRNNNSKHKIIGL